MTDANRPPAGYRDWPSVARDLGSQCSGPCGPQPCLCARLAEQVAVHIEMLEESK